MERIRVLEHFSNLGDPQVRNITINIIFSITLLRLRGASLIRPDISDLSLELNWPIKVPANEKMTFKRNA